MPPGTVIYKWWSPEEKAAIEAFYLEGKPLPSWLREQRY